MFLLITATVAVARDSGDEQSVVPICVGAQPTIPTAANGTVTITLSASDVLAVPALYLKVITNKFPNGEIGGQLGRGFGFGKFGGGH